MNMMGYCDDCGGAITDEGHCGCDTEVCPICGKDIQTWRSVYVVDGDCAEYYHFGCYSSDERLPVLG